MAQGKSKKAAGAVTSAESPTAGEINADAGADSAALPSDRPAASEATAGNPDTDTKPLEAEDAGEKETKETEVIEFFGPGKEVTIRRITDEDWTRLGYEGQETVDWRQENNWTVPMEHFKGNIPAMREFFNAQPDFRVVTTLIAVD